MILSQLKKGIQANNPVTGLIIGLCPAVLVTTTVINALATGLLLTAVLMLSNFTISALRKIIPEKERLVYYVVIMSGFITAFTLLTKSFYPNVSASLGFYIPLVLANGIILMRAEYFASKNSVLPSVLYGIFTGAVFTVALVIISMFRELLGTGVIFASSDGTGGIALLGSAFSPGIIFALPAGALLIIALLSAGIRKVLIKFQAIPADDDTGVEMREELR